MKNKTRASDGVGDYFIACSFVGNEKVNVFSFIS